MSTPILLLALAVLTYALGRKPKSDDGIIRHYIPPRGESFTNLWGGEVVTWRNRDHWLRVVAELPMTPAEPHPSWYRWREKPWTPEAIRDRWGQYEREAQEPTAVVSITRHAVPRRNAR